MKLNFFYGAGEGWKSARRLSAVMRLQRVRGLLPLQLKEVIPQTVIA
jgi:hypothetical protein